MGVASGRHKLGHFGTYHLLPACMRLYPKLFGPSHHHAKVGGGSPPQTCPANAFTINPQKPSGSPGSAMRRYASTPGNA